MVLRKMGGYIGLAGGAVGVTAAVFTLVLGGMGAAFAEDAASTFILQGWILLLCSLLCMVFGPLAVVGQGRLPGLVMVVASFMGMVLDASLGGRAAASVLLVPMVGGILALVGDRRSELGQEAPA